MNGQLRRQVIIERLEKTTKPVSATAFAQEFSVSRQVIVGDIALIRASGLAIRATSRGYLLERDQRANDFKGQLVCQHSAQDTAAELELIVGLGGKVLDVSVAHPLYGELTGNLDLKTTADVANFIEDLTAEGARLLSDLTGGIHLHTLICRDETHFLAIKGALQEAGFLYTEK